MNLVAIIKSNPLLTLDILQEFQKAYDEEYVSEDFEGFDKVRHTYAHMGKLFGRLATYIQMVEDGDKDFSPEDIKTKVIPDLLVYSFWLAEEFGVNVKEAYLTRMADNIQRVHNDSSLSKELKDHLAKRFQRNPK